MSWKRRAVPSFAERPPVSGLSTGTLALAIATALTLRAVFRLALRQTEGLIGSVMTLLGLTLAVPDHSTLGRRAETLEVPRPRPGSAPVHLLVESTGLTLCGSGEWLLERHGTKTRRAWRKLHIGVDADTGRIVAATLTTSDVDAASQVGPLLDQVMGLASFTADGAYDLEGVYDDVAARQPDAAVIAPPRCSAVPSDTAATAPGQRDRHVQDSAEQGRMTWPRTSGYHWRALVEADMSRFKRVIGDALRSRTERRRASEVSIAVDALNRMLDLGRPSYVRLAERASERAAWCVRLLVPATESRGRRGSQAGRRPLGERLLFRNDSKLKCL